MKAKLKRLQKLLGTASIPEILAFMELNGLYSRDLSSLYTQQNQEVLVEVEARRRESERGDPQFSQRAKYRKGKSDKPDNGSCRL
jgi:hypothetical protein